MSGSDTGRTDRPRSRRRLFDLAATVTIGAVIVGAALVPAITANSGGTTTIRGDVTSGGQPVPFTEIGFWSPTDGVIANTLADSGGRFALDVPDAVDGYVFAGAAPDAYNAITSLGDREYVRGLIGAKKAPGVSTPLYQGWPAATAKSLAGGKGDLHLVLQRPGAIAGRSPVTGPALRSVQVRRLDGSVVQTLKVDKQGRYRSDPLVPGTYAVAVLPNGPLLPQAVQVAVPSGGTVTAPQPALVAGATIRGVLTADGAALTAPVPVQLLRNGVEVATTTSSAAGAYSFGPLQAGDYEVRIGRYPDSGRVKSPTAEPVPVVGRTVAPTASASPSPTPTPSAPAVDGGTVQLQPVVRTSDAYLPTSVNAVVPDALGLVQVDTDLMPAGRIAGKVEGASGAPAQVLVEDAVSGQILRSAQVDAATGGYTAGGLIPGTEYRVYAVDRPADASQARYGEAAAVAETTPKATDLTLGTPTLTMSGTVAGVRSGSVVVGDPAAFTRSGLVADASGTYAVPGLVPGTYPVTVGAPGRATSSPVVVKLSAPIEQNLEPGPKPATYKAWFISGGAGVEHVSGTASSPAGDVLRIGPELPGGNATVTGLTPGVYTYDAGTFVGTAPTGDGPWWFGAPTGTFTLRAGATTDVGPVVLHAFAR